MLGTLSAPNRDQVGYGMKNLVRGTPTLSAFLVENVAPMVDSGSCLGPKMDPKNTFLMIGRHLEPQKTVSGNGS